MTQRMRYGSGVVDCSRLEEIDIEYHIEMVYEPMCLCEAGAWVFVMEKYYFLVVRIEY